MTPFPRRPQPVFWAERDREWRSGSATDAAAALHKRRHRGRTLAWWFHELVRPVREPRLCAYCDGELGSTSPPNIEHFVPLSRDRALGLAWTNLFPTCSTCNTTYKRDAWIPELVRPDRDWVVGWFEVTWRGALEPSGALDPAIQKRVRATIEVLGLNAKARCIARRQVLERALTLYEDIEAGGGARRMGSLKRLMRLLRGGPYRFVSRQAVARRSNPVA
jgi:uncharacterized protein (TIGR02646 family)